jgi:dTDP-4-dehydrorhamnose reductase
MVILVTGAHGQLGQALQSIAPQYPAIQFHFCSSQEADLTNKSSLKAVFTNYKPMFCINAAAYTAVDKAESEPEKAFAINADGVRNLAEVCLEHQTVLLHVSTDFVFDGLKNTPYTETDVPNPTGVYGASKLAGEQAVQEILTRYYIVRTAWVYSNFGANFMKTILRISNEKEEVSVVYDQIGTPTNAIDLAQALLLIIISKKQCYGIYNFSNEGQSSWFDFAKKIVEVFKIGLIVNPILTEDFPTLATRPKYSVLDKNKIKSIFNIPILSWENSLETYNV